MRVAFQYLCFLNSGFDGFEEDGLAWPPVEVECSIVRGGLSPAALMSLSQKTNVDTHRHIESSLWDQVCATKTVRTIVAPLTSHLFAMYLHCYHNATSFVSGVRSYQSA
jgi:hypothetical protein